MSWGGDWFESLNKGLKSVESLMESVDQTASATLKRNPEDADDTPIDISEPKASISAMDDQDSALLFFLFSSQFGQTV